MRVGIIGSGVVSQALGRGFANLGHEVMIGSRTPRSEKLDAWIGEVRPRGSTGTFDEAAAYGEIVVLATLGSATEGAIDMARPGNFGGKLVIDATNPLDFSKGVPPTLFVGLTDSLGERIQRKLPEALVVKCFNTVPNLQMVNPDLPGGPPDMIICGNDAEAKQQVGRILRDFGWPAPIDIGGIEEARWVEAYVPLWTRVATAIGTWDHALKVLRR